MDSIPSRHEGELDLHQLKILHMLLAERSLTRAAASLDLTQPAISKTLARLRSYFGDPLFVRVGMRMEPTPKAMQLAEPVKAILDRMRDLRNAQEAFDPAHSERTFSLFMVDAAVVQMLPPLLNHLRDHAPGVHVQAVRCDVQNLDLWLESGLVDFAIGVFPTLLRDIHRLPLWTESFASLARAGHPRQAALATREGFLREQHALVSASGTGHGYQQAEKILEEAIPSRHIVCRLPMFSAAAHLVKHSDCLTTLPRTVAATMGGDLGLHLFDCPIALPTMEIALYWHERYHRDAGNRWLREVLRGLVARPAQARSA
jgi:DNA-binding transcriptional LysR family regulator